MNWLTLYASWWAVILVFCGLLLLAKWVRRHGRGR